MDDVRYWRCGAKSGGILLSKEASDDWIIEDLRRSFGLRGEIKLYTPEEVKNAVQQ